MKSKILTFNVPDSEGDIFLPESVDTQSRPIITRDFDNSRPLGHADLFKDNDGLYACFDRKKFKGLYPVIGYQVIDSVKLENGLTEIRKIKLHQIGLCDKPNIDPTIEVL